MQNAAAASFWSQDNLSGNWGGSRDSLANKGYSVDIAYVTDLMSNVRGGVEKASERLDNFDLAFTIDGGKAFGLAGNTVSVYFIGNTGGDPTEHAGDMQGVSNIAADDTFKLYEAWVEQNFLDDALSFRMGLYDLNSEFDVMETAGLFLNSSHGIGPDYAQTGENGPSIFPTTSLGFRMGYQVTDTTYFRGVVLDGIPGDTENPYGTHVKLDSNDGLLVSGELGFATDPEDSANHYTKFAVGGWYYSKAQENNVVGDVISPKNNTGYYVIGERVLFKEAGSNSQGLAVFARFGMADNQLNAIDNYYSVGTVYTGLIPGRNDDQVGIAVANAHAGALVTDLMQLAGDASAKNETNIEVTYRAQLTPWMSMQPDVQYILNPSTYKSVADAVVVGSRFEFIF